MRDLEARRIPQTGAAAVWQVDFTPREDDQLLTDTCDVHDWTCIWCSMTPPICGSCRPTTPPCPANGRIHTCACTSALHAGRDDVERSA
jgi:hypothetical protein